MGFAEIDGSKVGENVGSADGEIVGDADGLEMLSVIDKHRTSEKIIRATKKTGSILFCQQRYDRIMCFYFI